jgi:hypothetical protein
MVDDNQHPLSSAATTDALAEAIAAKVADPAFAEFKKRMPELNEVGLLPVIKLRPTAVSDWIVVLPSGHQILLGDEDWKAARIPDVAQASQVASAAPVENKKGDQVHWLKVNDEPFEYAIQQGPHGDEFVKLLNGECLRRPIQSCSAGSDYEHGRLYVYDATSQTFDPSASDGDSAGMLALASVIEDATQPDFLQDILLDRADRLRIVETLRRSAGAPNGLIRAVPQTLPDRDTLWHAIAKEIACEEDCQKWPSGCGCAQKAADACLALSRPKGE